MTPLLCLEAVCTFLETLFREYRLPSSDGDRAIAVYHHFLPEPPQGKMNSHAEDGMPVPQEPGDEYEGLMPAVIVRPLKWGEQALGDGVSELTLCITVGVHSRDPQNQEGAQAVMNVLEHIRQALLSRRLLDQRYEIQTPVSWEFFNEELRPLWFGEMTTTWNIMEPSRIDTRDWQGNGYGGDFK